MITAIIPVYNESECIHDVLDAWCGALQEVDPTYHMIVIDDGSTDDSAAIIRTIHNGHVQLVSNENSGHGAAVYDGYIMALESGADYIFQSDSDGQTSPSDFKRLWDISQKNPKSAVIGYRKHRGDGLFRLISTRVLRVVVFLLTHEWILDSNTPFRIIPAPLLRTSLDMIPKRPDFTNILLSIVMNRQRRILFSPVAFEPRRTGRNSVNIGNMSRKAREAIREIKTVQ